MGSCHASARRPDFPESSGLAPGEAGFSPGDRHLYLLTAPYPDLVEGRHARSWQAPFRTRPPLGFDLASTPPRAPRARSLPSSTPPSPQPASARAFLPRHVLRALPGPAPFPRPRPGRSPTRQHLRISGASCPSARPPGTGPLPDRIAARLTRPSSRPSAAADDGNGLASVRLPPVTERFGAAGPR